jgi:putative membrane protein
MRRALYAFAVAAAPVLVFAHAGEDHEAARLSAAAAWSVATGITLTLLVALYLTGAVRLRRSDGGRETLAPWRITSFVAGVAAAAIALLSPLDRWSDVLFSMHMAQHEILMLVSAPLMVLGRPFIATLWGLTPRGRSRVAHIFQQPALRRGWELVTGPLTVLVLHAVVLWGWHIPRLFEAALQNESIHAVQHIGFFVTAALFWWALIHGRYGRIGYGVGVIYVFATAMHTQVLGALLTFGSRIWYPTHAARTMAAGLDPVDDQQFAGVMMWIPFGVIFVFIGLALFAAWLGEAERRVSYTTADQTLRGGGA